jgi:hypothetical protein
MACLVSAATGAASATLMQILSRVALVPLAAAFLVPVRVV